MFLGSFRQKKQLNVQKDRDTTTDDDTSSDVFESELASIVLCENFVNELKRGLIHDRIDGYHKESEFVICSVTSFTMEETMRRFHQRCVFKVNNGFEEGGRFVEDLLDINFADLYSYSKKYRFDFDFENKFTKAWIN